LANELSRVGDRLTRARERIWNGVASVWLPPPAQREPARVGRPPEQAQLRRDAGAEANKRAPATLVAIHVEVRHPTGDAVPTARVIDAQVADVDELEDRFYTAAPLDEAPTRPALRAENVRPTEPFFMVPALGSEPGPANKQAGPGGGFHYVAARALSAYLAQHSLFSASAADQPLLDLQA
jgi:hypothetical protein